MIDPWIYELARLRQQELLARADRFRLGRIAKQAKPDSGSRQLRCPLEEGSVVGWVHAYAGVKELVAGRRR